jgi:hypothetical protein
MPSTVLPAINSPCSESGTEWQRRRTASLSLGFQPRCVKQHRKKAEEKPGKGKRSRYFPDWVEDWVKMEIFSFLKLSQYFRHLKENREKPME